MSYSDHVCSECNQLLTFEDELEWTFRATNRPICAECYERVNGMGEQFDCLDNMTCPECESNRIKVYGNISPDEYFCECAECGHEFEAFII